MSIVSTNDSKRLDGPHHKKPRSPFRQRMIDTEHGVKKSIRGESAFFVHFFVATIVFSSALVLDISLVQWAVITLAVTTVVAMEVLHHAIKTLIQQTELNDTQVGDDLINISTAAVTVTFIGGSIAVGLLLVGQLIRSLG